MKNKVSYFRRSVLALVIISLVGMSTPLYAKSTVKDHRTDAEKMDSIENTLPYLEQKVLSTLMSGASKPVQFSGEARLKGQYHLFTTYPDYLGPHTFEGTQNKEISGDQSYLQTGWEASVLRFGLVVRPGRNTILWSRFGFSHTFPGNRVPDYNGGLSPSQEKHNATGWPTNVFEDMCAGIAIRTVPFSFWLKMGNILWTEASPFTIWKAQGRMFGWEYLPYEIEQPISRYYEYNIAKGEKIGRAAWHKKAFDGINLESINLPLDFYLNLVYGKFMEYDKFEREYMDFATDLGYAAENDTLMSDIIETGTGDSYRHIFHTRLAKKMKSVTLGLNYNNVHVSEDIIYAQNPYGIFFNTMFDLEYYDRTYPPKYQGPNWFTEAKFYRIDSLTGNIIDSTISSHLPSGYIGPGEYADTLPLDCGKGYYKECQVFSVDLRGNIGSKFELHADIGLSRVDTNWIYGDTIQTAFVNDPPLPITIKKRETTSSNFIPAIYAKLKFNSKVILESDLAYISPGFYSPFSLACPMDAFYAFGTNLLGAGTFVGPSEASPYFQNMAGGWLSVSPQLRGYGHFKVKYGQHLQLQEARDLLFFPYRLNGMDLNSILLSTYAKWGVGTIDFPYPDVKYDRRLGDESYDPKQHIEGGAKAGSATHLDEGPDKGGLRADYLSVYEGFVPYTDPLDLLMNYKCTTGKIQRDRSFVLVDTVRFVADKKVQEGFAGIEGMSIDTTMKDTVIHGKTVQMIKVFDTTGTVYTDLNGFVPMHKKYSFNFEIDGSYDIGPLIHYKNDFFVGGYLGISGVSTHPKALAFSEKDDDVLLWSLYLRLEPAIALSKKFYIIGLYGYETWRSDKAWMNVDRSESNNSEDTDNPIFQRVPINYQDVAYGLGFDWDALDRVGLHTRFKWMKHKDVEHNENNMKWFLISMEITTFF